MELGVLICEACGAQVPRIGLAQKYCTDCLRRRRRAKNRRRKAVIPYEEMTVAQVEAEARRQHLSYGRYVAAVWERNAGCTGKKEI